jgi:hypothetical protein
MDLMDSKIINLLKNIKNNNKHKTKNLTMKNFKKITVILIAFATFLFFINSCTKEKPLCERNNFGHVTIHNNTNISLWVDATNAGSLYNDETRLSIGSSHTFTVDPGTVTIWAASDINRQLDSWNTDKVTIVQCDEYSYTWRSAKGEGDGTYNDAKGFGITKK